MTIQESANVKPYETKVKVVRNGKIMLVRLIQTSRDAKTNRIRNILFKCDDGNWYTNEEVEFV